MVLLLAMLLWIPGGAQAAPILAPAWLDAEPSAQGTHLTWTLDGRPDTVTLTRYLEDGSMERVDLDGDARAYTDPRDDALGYTVAYSIDSDESPPSNPAVPYPNCFRLVETSPLGLPYDCYCPQPGVGYLVCDSVPIWP